MVIKQAVKELCALLSTPEKDYEAREILREVTGTVDPFAQVSERQLGEALSMARRRSGGEPLQYIFGHWEFCGCDITVGEGVLIPRPETEELACLVCDHLKKTGGSFLDLCSGSGCISVFLAAQTGCKGYAVELYDKAFSFLRKNLEKNGVGGSVNAIQGDVLKKSTADVFENESLFAIVSNPPYINAADMRSLQKEVTFEPETALYGGEDGLDYYRTIVPLYSAKLAKGGIFAVETGEEQGAAVAEIFEAAGLVPTVKKDIFGQDRIVYAIK